MGSFGNELKDFISAFETGYKMFKSPEERRAEEEDKQWVRTQRDWKTQDRAMAIEDRATKNKWDAEDRANAEQDRAWEISGRPLERRAKIAQIGATEANIREAERATREKEKAAIPDYSTVNGVLAAGGYQPTATNPAATAAPPSPYDSLLEKWGDKYGVAPEVAKSIAHVESAGDPMAISLKGAGGIMQLMPGTATDLGVTDVHDPEQNIEGGVRYFAQLQNKYGDLPTALAAYNWGPGNVDRWISEGQDPAKLPKETQDYIARVTSNVVGHNSGSPVADTGNQPQNLIAMGRNVVRDAMNGLAEETGLTGGVPAPGSQQKAAAVLQGTYNSAKPDDVEVLFREIRKQLPKDASDEEVGMKAFGAMYEYYNKIGKPELAQGAAKQLLQYYQNASNKWSAIAAAAAEKGDNDKAMNAAVKAYANIPDGREMKYNKNKDGSYTVTFKDIETGQVQEKHILTPDMIGSLAMKLANPQNFSDSIIRAAGLKAQGGSPEFQKAMTDLGGVQQPDTTAPNARLGSNVVPGGVAIPDKIDYAALAKMSDKERGDYLEAFKAAQPPEARERRPEDMAKFSEAANQAFETRLDPEGAGAKLPPEVSSHLKAYQPIIENSVTKLLADNRNKNMTAPDALGTVMDMSIVDPANPGMFPAKILGKNKDGTVTVKVPGHPTVTMSEEDLNAIGVVWAKSAKDYIDRTTTAGQATKKSAGNWKAFTDSLGPAGLTITNDLGSGVISQGLQSLVQPDFPARLGRAIMPTTVTPNQSARRTAIPVR